MRRQFSPQWLALLAVTLIALYLCWLIVQPFVTVILWALVLAIVANPLYRWLRRRGRGPNVAALLTTIVVVLAVVVPLSLMALAMVRQAVGAAEGLQRMAVALLNPESEAYRFVAQYIDLDQLRDPQFLTDHLKQLTGAVAGRTLGLVGGIIGGVVSILFILFTLFFFLRDAGVILPAIRDSLPLERDEADAVINRTHEVIQASIYGIVVIAAVQGALGGLAFWILQLPSPLLWGVAMFLLSMVPLVGSAIIWLPAALFLLATGAYGKGSFLILWGVLVIGMVDNFLRPRIVGERARLHELVVLFSVLGGLQVFGILGLVVGPVVVAITISLLDVARRANRTPPRTVARAPSVEARPSTIETVGPVVEEPRGSAAMPASGASASRSDGESR